MTPATQLPADRAKPLAAPPLSFERERLAAWLSAEQLRTWEHWSLAAVQIRSAQVAQLYIVELVTDVGLPTEDRTEGNGDSLDAAIADALRIYGFARGEMP